MIPNHDEDAVAYWKANIRLVLTLLIIWFVASFGAAIVFADFLDQYQIAGFPLGFWMGHQGSIYIFVVLTFYYVYKMGKIDRFYRSRHPEKFTRSTDFEI